jgi:poly(hydroxyalkanoate) granule-associated protein
MAVRKKGKGRRTAAKRARARGTVDSVIEAGQQIWLAGLGAFARTQREGPKLFESLVEEGTAVQDVQRAKVEHFVKGAWKGVRQTVDARTERARTRANETLDDLETMFQTRVQKALQQLGMPTSQEIGALSRKVNELNRSVQALTRSKPSAARRAATPATEEGNAVI